MQEMMYGYIRVSTKDQHEDRQMIAMQEFGVSEKRIYMDKLSGKDFDRPQYKRLLRRLRRVYLATRTKLSEKKSAQRA